MRALVATLLTLVALPAFAAPANLVTTDLELASDGGDFWKVEVRVANEGGAHAGPFCILLAGAEVLHFSTEAGHLVPARNQLRAGALLALL